MAKSDTPTGSAPDDEFDDLLALDEDEPGESENSSSTPEDPQDNHISLDDVLPKAGVDIIVSETADQKRIRELEEKLERATAALEAAAERSQPSKEELQAAKDKAHAQATLETKRITESPVSYDEDDGEEKIIIHVLEDGFTAFASTWMKGQELEIAVDGRNYQRTVDRTGKSWLDLRNDPTAQRRRWGKVMFGEGPYPWRDGEVFDLNAAKEDARRRRAIPISF